MCRETEKLSLFMCPCFVNVLKKSHSHFYTSVFSLMGGEIWEQIIYTQLSEKEKKRVKNKNNSNQYVFFPRYVRFVVEDANSMLY